MQYIQIKEAIAEQINSGVLMPRQKLPSERQLAQSFSTTRITLREALSLLEAEGVIYREDRRGWFISSKPLIYNPMQNLSFLENAKIQQREPKLKLIKAKKIMADKKATQALCLSPFSTIYQIDQTQYLETTPVSFAQYSISTKLLPNLLQQNLAQPLKDIYQKDIEITNIKHRFYTSSFTGHIAQALRVTDGAPCTVIERISFLQNKDVIELCVEYWRHNAIQIEI